MTTDPSINSLKFDLRESLARPSERHAHVYERLSVCCGAVRQDRSLALYDADLEPVCSECGTLASFESRCWCGMEEAKIS